jgi:hypothetical protein
MDGKWPLGELKPSVEVDVLPSHRGDLLDQLATLDIATHFSIGQQAREEGGIVVDDAVGDQAAALIPDFLLLFVFEAQLTEVGIGDGPA